jgi:hypothetical protein
MKGRSEMVKDRAEKSDEGIRKYRQKQECMGKETS